MLQESRNRRDLIRIALGLGLGAWSGSGLRGRPARAGLAAARDYRFERTISRPVLENYLSRAITMEGMLHGRGDLGDDLRMLKDVGAKFLGRAICLWAGEDRLLDNLERARRDIPRVVETDPDMIVQACIFEIVTTNVDRVPIPSWAFEALRLPIEARNFRYADMLFPDGKFRDHWNKGASVPDVGRPETQLWFHFLAASYIDMGVEAIHYGQVELMNRNDRDLAYYAKVFELAREHAARKGRRGMILCDAHVPGGGLVRDGKLLLDFHSFPLRVKEAPGGLPLEGILEVGHYDSFYGRSRGGKTYSGWECEHLPYLAEIDNWGSSRKPGQPDQGGAWIWGYDEICWFAHLPADRRAEWLRYAWDWIREHDPNGFLQMPGGRTLASGVDGRRWYHANAPSAAVPDGFGDEAAIRAVWASDSKE